MHQKQSFRWKGKYIDALTRWTGKRKSWSRHCWQVALLCGGTISIVFCGSDEVSNPHIHPLPPFLHLHFPFVIIVALPQVLRRETVRFVKERERNAPMDRQKTYLPPLPVHNYCTFPSTRCAAKAVYGRRERESTEKREREKRVTAERTYTRTAARLHLSMYTDICITGRQMENIALCLLFPLSLF